MLGLEEIKKNEPSVEQLNLKKHAGTELNKEEAAFIWERVIDHKWYMSERLKPDIGLRVAAVDYVENFYDPSIFRRKNNKRDGFFKHKFNPISQLARNYFLSKSKTLFSL